MDNIFRIIIEAALALLLLCSLCAALYMARRTASKPLPLPDGTELFCVIAARGAAAELEQTVRGLLWLGDSGELKNSVIIADCGLNGEAVKLAALFACKTERVTVCPPEALPLVLEENGWSRVENT